VDALGRDPALPEELHHLLEMLKMTQVIRSRLVAAVDQKRVGETRPPFRACLRIVDRRDGRATGEHDEHAGQKSVHSHNAHNDVTCPEREERRNYPSELPLHDCIPGLSKSCRSDPTAQYAEDRRKNPVPQD
jgi:hypothetical protein